MAGSTGNSGNSNSLVALARYNSNGSLDTTFGNGGKVTTDFGGVYASASSMTLDSNGKILVAGILYTIFLHSSDDFTSSLQS